MSCSGNSIGSAARVDGRRKRVPLAGERRWLARASHEQRLLSNGFCLSPAIFVLAMAGRRADTYSREYEYVVVLVVPPPTCRAAQYQHYKVDPRRWVSIHFPARAKHAHLLCGPKCRAQVSCYLVFRLRCFLIFHPLILFDRPGQLEPCHVQYFPS